MAGQLGGIPILVLKAGSERTRGKDAQIANIMLVDSLGDVVITNDGVTILKEMDIDSPAAKMMVEVAKTVEDVAGDGTTTAVVLGAELLKKAEELLELELHPTVITLGYRLAAEKAKKVLDEIGKDIDIEDVDELKKIAETAITGKAADASRDFLAEIAINADKAVAEEVSKGKRVALRLRSMQIRQ
jgi:chaperonin GroEL (HSP60 family)